ncbi:MAG: hypothetical protein EP305_04895 [Bacteroidetes bacterium]|nr:MAG: hypothetical protein EP305_04895 [Bacteroidota bacterium]
MTYRNLGEKTHTAIHLIALSGLAAGLPTNKIVLSLSLMIGILNLVMEANFIVYWEKIKKSKSFLLITALFVLHFIGIIWSNDVQYALNDIRIKIPLVLIPLFFTVKPIDGLGRHLITTIFILSVLVTSLINVAYHQHWIGNREYLDIRDLSLFGSHIRYGILVAIASLIIFYEIIIVKRWYLLPVLGWLVYYTFYSQVLSGVLALAAGLIGFIFVWLYNRTKLGGVLSMILIAVSIVLLVRTLMNFSTPKNIPDISTLEQTTNAGNAYTHQLEGGFDLNGDPVLIYVCEKELREEWSKRSSIHYDSLDQKQQPIKYTIIRYLASKGQRKDAEGIQSLTEKDVQNIQLGKATQQETENSFRARLSGLHFQLLNQEDPNGHSLLQRLEYWKTGLRILQRNWFIGVGTGDVQQSFDQQYEADKSKLLPERRLRAHNQFLTFGITFGFFGLLLFILMLWHYFKIGLQHISFLTVAFIFIAASTFFIEDTLETQTGATLFAFFYAFFCPRED